MVFDSGMIRVTKILTSPKPCGKRRSFLVDLRVQIDETTRLVLQMGNSENIVTCPKKMPYFDGLMLRRGVKEMGANISRRIVDQQSMLEACRLKTLLGGEACTTRSVT